MRRQSCLLIDNGRQVGILLSTSLWMKFEQMTTDIKINLKKQQIIDTAMPMFYLHGIHAVGINEILKVSGIAKKTLYHHFESKEALIVATLNLRHANFIRWLSTILETAESPQRALVDVFNGLDDWFNHRVPQLGSFRGCFFINASAEYSEPGHPIFEACSQHKTKVNTLFLKQTQLFTNDDQEAERLANVLSILKDGCITAAHVQNDSKAALKVIDTVRALVGI